MKTRPIDSMIDEWNRLGTPTEERLKEALEYILKQHQYRLKLEGRIHNQRAVCRTNWQIVEMRNRWLGTGAVKRMYQNLLDSHKQLLRKYIARET
jgi:hypothetical protein